MFLVNIGWWKENFLWEEIFFFSEFLSVLFKVFIVNGSLMLFDGYVNCCLFIGGIGLEMIVLLLVFWMVFKEKFFIGYNVIEYYM